MEFRKKPEAELLLFGAQIRVTSYCVSDSVLCIAVLKSRK
jgi:hypothetical protein